MQRPRAASALVLGIACLLLPAAADAATLRVPEPVERDCTARALPAGAAGVASFDWTAPADGLLTARLDAGPAPDWDLALIRDGVPLGGSTAFGSVEQATVGVRAGEEIRIQACRRDGPAESAALGLSLFRTAGIEAPAGRVSLERVQIGSPADLERLDRLGIDVTHDVSPDAATVALYDDGQRALLSSAGFQTTTLIPDLAAKDAAARRAEDRSAASDGPGARSALPTGRESYRVYEDYTSELKQLAEQNPALVRPLTIGSSYEGRPIEGVEIAADVHRTDDGRPVYLNFGLHHAREWASGEMPMEFAHDLVDGFNAGDARIEDLLGDVRVAIVPVVNPDGFVASRSYGTSPLDDDENATLPQAVANQAAYIRKNCRPTGFGDAAVPCALRTGSGVDLNRNYGYYWGGPGSSTDATTQGYRGTAPFSEPETQAVHNYTSSIQPTVFITNHSFTTDGKWLRQPGFDASFLPADGIGAFAPDEVAMKGLGDAMAAATGWTSERGYETLGDITGATEDWNYFAQGTYGYTPEARGTDFHANYQQMMVKEYLGDASHTGLGVREAFLVAGERAADRSQHSVIQGTVPPGATLTVRKQFEAPTFSQPALNVEETLHSTITGPAGGTYSWDVNPSDRPATNGGATPAPGDEQWTMTCRRAGQTDVFTTTVEVTRNQSATVDWGNACGPDPPVNAPPAAGFDFAPAAPEPSQQVNLFSTSSDPDGAIDTTDWDLDDDGQFDDASGLVATTSFGQLGSHDVSVRATDDQGEPDEHTRTIVVVPHVDPPVNPPAKPSASCRGRAASIVGTSGRDRLNGTSGSDVIAALGGRDRIRARGGNDVICGGTGRDRIDGGPGTDVCRGGPGRDRLRRCP